MASLVRVERVLRAAQPVPAGPQRIALIEEAAQAQTRALGLAEGEFLPFAASWPQARDGYLAWLDQHEAQGAQFREAEADRTTLAMTLMARDRSKPYLRSAASEQTITAEAPSEIGEHMGRVIG